MEWLREYQFILERLLFSGLLLCLMIVPIQHALHMFQQNRYECGRYTKWGITELKRVKSWVLILIAAVLLLACFVMPTLLLKKMTLIWLCVGLGTFILLREGKKQYIKPLHVTARVLRQIIVMVLLNLIWVLPCVILTEELWWPLWAWLALWINWLLIYLMAVITSPFEKLVKRHYQKIAKDILTQHQHLIKVGITGSYGKTSSKNILQEILSEKFYSLMTPASFNTPMGITITIRQHLKSTHEVFICEMGADHVGDIEHLTRFVMPQIGLVTSIGPQHLNTFGSLENIIQEKMKMIENLPSDGFGVLNKDNELIRNYTIKNSCAIAWYGIEQEDVDYRGIDIDYGAQGSTFTVWTREHESIPFKTRLLGQHNIANILASIAVGRHLGVSWQQLQKAVAQMRYVEHRLEVKKINGLTFIDDAFNSNPVGSAMSLDVLEKMPGRRYIVTPGMIDLGDKQSEINMEFGRKMLHKADFVILVGQRQTEPILQGLTEVGFDPTQILVVSTVKEAFQYLYQQATAQDTILLENDLPDAFNH